MRITLLCLVLSAALPAQPDPVAAGSRPNIVLVFIDDMGWGDFSCFGNRQAKTPEVDRLAAEGIRFEQFYVNSPICSPSRTAITTGQYPQRWRITSYLAHRRQNTARGMAQWLDPKAPSLARCLRRAGYATGHFGKWHMGGQRDVDDAPLIARYGFEVALTNFEGMGPKLLPLVLEPGQAKPRKIWAGAERLGEGFRWMLRSEITGGFVDAALGLIAKAQEDGRPFYINLWPDDVHGPFWPSVARWSEDPRQRYLAVLEEMDRQLGKLFARIRADERLRRNTLILVCSDNGPAKGAGSAGPLRGFKTMLYEGGIRSPLVAWGPGVLARSGQVDKRSMFSAIDLVPTLIALAGAQQPDGVRFDGEMLLPTLRGEGGSREAPLYFRRPPDRDSFYGIKDLPDLAVRAGNMKLLCEYDGSDAQLYDLDADPGERQDLAAERPETTTRLKRMLLAWHRAMPADRGAELAARPQRK